MKTLPIRGHKLVYDTKKPKQHKIFYKCKKGCPIQAFIKLSEYNQTCELWITAHEHDHTNASQNLLPLTSKQKVMEYSNLGVKPKEIVRSIRNEGNLVQLTFQQIYNIRNYEKAKRLGDTKMNLKEFIEWCENNSGIPDDEDEVFILNFEYKLNGSKAKIKYVRAIFTTKRLLRFCLESKYLNLIM
jgi:hypothetical protein